MPTFLAPVSVTTSAAAAGHARYANDAAIAWRNVAGTGDAASIRGDLGNSLYYSSVTWHRFDAGGAGEVFTIRGTQVLSTIPWTTSGAFLSVGTNPAAQGVLRLPDTGAIWWRNNTNTGDTATIQGNAGILYYDQLNDSGYHNFRVGAALGDVLRLTLSQATLFTNVLVSEGKNLLFGTTTGTKLGTTTSQKLSFWNVTPIVQPANTVAIDDLLTNTGLRAAGGTANFTTAISTAGLTGATAASRLVGATTTGKPTTGTFAKGDVVVDQAGKIWINTTAGSPGTWTDTASAGPYWSDAKWGVD